MCNKCLNTKSLFINALLYKTIGLKQGLICKQIDAGTQIKGGPVAGGGSSPRKSE